MIEGFYEACSDKRLGHDFRRQETSQLFRTNMKSIRKVDNDLPVPLIELIRNILVGRKGNSKEDHLSLIRVLKGLGNDSGPEFFPQRCECCRSTRVCDSDLDLALYKRACECGTDVAGTNDGVLHRDFQSLSGC